MITEILVKSRIISNKETDHPDPNRDNFRNQDPTVRKEDDLQVQKSLMETVRNFPNRRN